MTLKQTRKRVIDTAPEQLFSFLWPKALKDRASHLVKRGKQFKVSYSYAYILREGARMFILRQNKMLDRVEQGAFHVKRRQKLKRQIILKRK